MRLFDGGMSGIFRFVVKFNIPGYNWQSDFLKRFTIIFHDW